jgi:hypothetical protein
MFKKLELDKTLNNNQKSGRKILETNTIEIRIWKTLKIIRQNSGIERIPTN